MSTYKHIYVGQPVQVMLDTKTDLSSATTTQIRFVKPNGAGIGTKNATVNGQLLSADFLKDEIDIAGEWEFRAWVEFGANTGIVPGVPYKHKVEKI